MQVVKAISTAVLAVAALSACEQVPTPEQLPPGATTVILDLTATKTYNPSVSYTDGNQVVSKDTVITLPSSIGITAGTAGNGDRVALSFDGGTVDTLTGIRCYYTNSGGTNYAFSSCDGGAGGLSVWPYYNAGDAVQIKAGDTLVLRVMSGNSSTPTSVKVSIAGIQQN